MEITLERSFLAGEDDEDGARPLELHTSGGVIHARFHPSEGGDAGVLWVFGAGGGLGGPAGGLYTRLAKQLKEEGVSSLRVDYRNAGDLVSCVLDVFTGTYFLGTAGCTRVILVGHSFGGAVVICAAAADPAVIGVAALSSQLAGTTPVMELAGKPVLLMHGTRDEVLPHVCSEEIFRRASEPKSLRLYDCMHGLDECRDDIDRDLASWIRQTFAAAPAPATVG